MDSSDTLRRIKKRFLDVNHTYRRLFFLAVGAFGLIWLFGFRLFSFEEYRPPAEPGETCLAKYLHRFDGEVREMDTNIVHEPPMPEENLFLPYVGNGYIGSPIFEEATIHIKPVNGRVLTVPLPFRPMVRASTDEDSRREAKITQYVRGSVQHISCLERGSGEALIVASKFYAHRTNPSVFEQDITITNPSAEDAIVAFEQLGLTGDPRFKSEQKKIQQGDDEINYMVGTVLLEVERRYIGVALAYKKVRKSVEVKAKSTITERFITVVNYVHLTSKKDYDNIQSILLNKSEMELKRALGIPVHNFQNSHEKAWQELWVTGFYISTSRANGALNGDKINATMYYVLSQVRAPLHEVNVPAAQVSQANAVLAYSEGCYSGHHTLQAPSLWSNLQTESDILSVSNYWLVTLYQLGCHNLLKAGASGVVQGMVLSFGSLKFSNHHLEFNTDPKDLHRDYHFRRIWYGNATHVNISVSVGEDNKAVLFVALDRSDKDYYACDAGCLDAPVELGPRKKQFPVKLTDPVTALLYITSDRKHVEELRLSIHVKEVLEAPPHENHVISMHKHGSGYGTMSTMFWISISLLIILFHLFLFHLVYTEYFGSQEKFRSRSDPMQTSEEKAKLIQHIICTPPRRYGVWTGI